MTDNSFCNGLYVMNDDGFAELMHDPFAFCPVHDDLKVRDVNVQAAIDANFVHIVDETEKPYSSILTFRTLGDEGCDSVTSTPVTTANPEMHVRHLTLEERIKLLEQRVKNLEAEFLVDHNLPMSMTNED